MPIYGSMLPLELEGYETLERLLDKLGRGTGNSVRINRWMPSLRMNNIDKEKSII